MGARAADAGPVRWVLCDLGGVVVHVDSARVVTELSRRSGRPLPEVLRLLDADLLAAYEEGRLESRQFFERLAASLALAMTYAEFTTLWNRIFTENTAMTLILQRLRERCTVAALSNTNALHFQHLMATLPATMGLFHQHLLSFQLGRRKPDPQLYVTALERLGATPWGTVYIDDREELVAVGRSLGLHGIRFRDAEQVRTELCAVGLAV